MEIIRDVFQFVPFFYVIAWWIFGLISAFLFIVGIRRHVRAWRQGKAEQLPGTTLSRVKKLL